MHLQGFSQIFKNIVQFWGWVVLGPGPVHGPWSMEKLTLGSVENCQSPPSCLEVSLQGVKKPDIDLPKMHFSPVRGLEASQSTLGHLGGVYIGKSDLL